MICADTSVWIDHFRRLDTPETAKLHVAVLDGPIVMGDLIMMELLRGASSEKKADDMETLLRQFTVVSMLGDRLAIVAARHYRTMRSAGYTVRKPNDLIIATYCIEHDIPLLHRDRDFDQMPAYIGLRIH